MLEELLLPDYLHKNAGSGLHWPKLGYMIIAEPIREAKEKQSSVRPERSHISIIELGVETRTSNGGWVSSLEENQGPTTKMLSAQNNKCTQVFYN